MIGAHTIKQGLSRYLVDFIRRGRISIIACNGACAIHDYELARIGATSESVAENITAGQFGMWRETAELNDIVSAGNAEGLGFGESVGRAISQSDFPHKDVSVFAAAWEAGIPATVHIGIGHDIIHQHPNFDAVAAGQGSHRDFLIYAKVIENLSGGAVLCFGTAVMGPEVYLKAQQPREEKSVTLRQRCSIWSSWATTFSPRRPRTRPSTTIALLRPSW
jgi:hypothetical protein